MKGKRVVVVGAGLAGLAAGIELAEKGADVTLVNMGHHKGGRATSWRDALDFPVEHGFHVVLGFYDAFRDLMDRAGIREDEVLHDCEGWSYFFEPAKGELTRVHSSWNPITTTFSSLIYGGLDLAQKANVAAFSSENWWAIFHADMESVDDMCFTTWAVQRGLDASILNTNLFRFMRDGFFNWPHEISAYIALMSIRSTFASPSTVRYSTFAGPIGELVMTPLARHLERLKGKVVEKTKLVGFVHDGKRIKGLKLAAPDPAPHALGQRRWEGSVPVVAGTERVETGFDAVVLAIPPDCVRELGAADPALLKGGAFGAIQNLRTVATLSWQLWLDRAVTPELEAPVNGLSEPLGMVWDAKRAKRSYASDDRFRAALEFVGQEAGFEEWTDQEIQDHVLEEFAKVPGFKDIRGAKVVHSSFNRNRANHERFLLTEPGVTRFRPVTRARPFENLYLAGDWIRNDLDFPCMEAAIRTGLSAARAILEDMT